MEDGQQAENQVQQYYPIILQTAEERIKGKRKNKDKSCILSLNLLHIKK